MFPLFELIELFVDPDPHPAAFNMAMDEILLSRAEHPILRVYRWEHPSVSFGYFEKYEAIKVEYPDRELVRRWTGGGVVPHGGDLTYSLLVPAGAPFLRLRTGESYRAIHECIARALNRAGTAVSMAGAADPKISQACFENAAQYDILRSGRKIAGAAQRRTKSGLLHQGSIQNVELPVSFGEGLAVEFSDRVIKKTVGPDVFETVSALAETKYASVVWMRKF